MLENLIINTRISLRRLKRRVKFYFAKKPVQKNLIPLKKNAIITGAASGLGKAIALRLAKDGWHVALADLNQIGSQVTLREIVKAGGSAQVEYLDVTNLNSWAQLSIKLRQKWRTLDLLVNNAGVSGSGEIGVQPIEEWQKIIDTNLWGTIYGCHTFVDWLKANPRRSNIVNVSSAMAFNNGPTVGAYGAAKAGIISLSETLYTELRKYGVDVTVICPAFFATNILRNSKFTSANERKYAISEMNKSKLTVEMVADQTVEAIYKRRFYVFTPFVLSRLAWFAKRLWPSFYLRLVERVGNRRLKTLSKSRAA